MLDQFQSAEGGSPLRKAALPLLPSRKAPCGARVERKTYGPWTISLLVPDAPAKPLQPCVQR